MERREPGESESSKALFALLAHGGTQADAVRSLFDRTSLWRYSKGKTTPSADVAARLEEATDGEVPANGWDAEANQPASDRVPTVPPTDEKAAG